MYIIKTSLYPNDKVKEVADMYLKMITKYPPDDSLVTPIVPVAVLHTLEGIKVINIYEVKKGKLEDALIYEENRLAMYGDIQGYRYSIETWMNLEEALKTIGM